MAFTVPTLDDRTYRDLVEEGFRLIGSGEGDWTNRNPSDPGVTLLELLAYFAEMLIYRVNQLGDEDLRAFARLLDPESDHRTPVTAVGDADARDREHGSAAAQLQAALAASRRRERVVSCSDFEAAALAATTGIARAHCVANRDLTQASSPARRAERPGHVTVLIIPQAASDDQARLIEAVRSDLEARRLLGTRVHVGTPQSADLRVRLTITMVPGASATAVREHVESALTRFFDPVAGGPDGRGWPLGRPVFVSEIYQLVDRQPGVDYATRTLDGKTGQPLDELVVDDAARMDRGAGALVAVRLEPQEILRFRAAPDLLRFQSAAAGVSDAPEA